MGFYGSNDPINSVKALKDGPKVAAPYLWNQLPTELRESDTFSFTFTCYHTCRVIFTVSTLIMSHTFILSL